MEAGCVEPVIKGKRRCGWHWVDRQDIETQERLAQIRLNYVRGLTAGRFSRRPPIPGGRWCSGCQSYVPLFYTSGSKCKACARRSRRASHVERTYNITAEEERNLFEWQGGRCFVCGRKAKTRQLAVDHDHETGAVRGLLCSDDKFGCNVTLRRLLGDRAAAQRLVAYATQTPLERMRAGAEPWRWAPSSVRHDGPPPF